MFLMMKNKLLLLLALISLALTPVKAAENPFKISEDLDKSIKEGLHDLYELKFEQAEEIFTRLKPQAEDHPMVAFGMASVHWWRLSVYVLENDEEESKKFLDAAEECIELSKKKIDSGDTTGEGYLTLGGASGLLGRWQATTGKYGAAYFTGRKAIKSLRKALKTNPEMKDANMGLGIFDYYVATLPRIVRALTFLGANNDPQVGINELKVAATEGTYAQIPSKLFLADIFSNPENKPDKALEILADLRKDIPQSSFVHMMAIFAQYNRGVIEDLKKETAEFQAKVANGFYPSSATTQGHFAEGLVAFKQKEWPAAVNNFNLAIASGTTKDPFYTWAWLYKGFALDASGRREEAVAAYKNVLAQIRRWGSHEMAKRYSDKPFMGTDDDLKKIKL